MHRIAGKVSPGLALLLAFALVPMAAHQAGAEGLVFEKTSANPVKSKLAQFRSQTRLLDTRLSGQYGNSDKLKPVEQTASLSLPGTITPQVNMRYRGKYLAVARAAAARHSVPQDLFLRLVQQESGWNPTAISPKGARGLAQLMPETAALLGVDAMDPFQNLEGGARYLRMMYDRFGSWRLALAAYNAGPMAVDKHGDVPPYQETQNYVAAIAGS